MLRKLRFAKRLFRDLPNHAKLAYCLLRDDRVPMQNKAAFGAALTVGLNPFINLPEFIPVVGELDALAVTLLALRVFIASAPPHLVEEHRELLSEERSAFDRDVRRSGGFRAGVAHGLGNGVSATLGTFGTIIGRRLHRATTIDQTAVEVHDTPTPSSERQYNA